MAAAIRKAGATHRHPCSPLAERHLSQTAGAAPCGNAAPLALRERQATRKTPCSLPLYPGAARFRASRELGEVAEWLKAPVC
jgi:hypothetical protein